MLIIFAWRNNCFLHRKIHPICGCSNLGSMFQVRYFYGIRDTLNKNCDFTCNKYFTKRTSWSQKLFLLFSYLHCSEDNLEGCWSPLTRIPHVECCNFGCAVLQNQLYVVGGCFNNQDLQENVHPFGFRYCARWVQFLVFKIETSLWIDSYYFATLW